MTEPDDRETRQALRAMLSDRIGTLTPPVGVYERVRRRHRRRQRGIVGGAVVLAVAAVAVPSIALPDRPATPAAADRPAGPRCAFPGYKPGPAPEGVQLPAQRNVPGSLGGDAELVAAVLRAGWSVMRAEDAGTLLDPDTARVRMLERAEGQVVALVSAAGLDRRLLTDTWVWGPDGDHLVGFPAGAVRSPSPVPTAYAIGDVLLQAIDVCGLRYVVVAAAPGTTGRASWISAITPQLRAERSTLAVPLRADGIAVFRLDAFDVRIRLERAGQSVWDRGLQSQAEGPPWMLTEKDLDRVAAEAPGDGDPDLVRSIVTLHMSGSNLPVPQSDARVLWSGRARSGWTAVVGSSTLPGGVQYVTVGISNAVNSAYGDYFGLLAPGALERTVLAWGANRPGRPLVVFAVGGLRAEAVLAGGDVTRFALSGGGGVLESGATVRRVRVYGAGDRLIGEQVPGQGLVDVPRETPL